MPIEFSPANISIIENMMMYKRHKAIAEMIEMPLQETGELIEALCKEKEVMSYQTRMETLVAIRNAGKPKKLRPARKKRIRKKAGENEEQKLARERKEERAAAERQRVSMQHQRNKERELARKPIMKIKVVDYSEMKRIKVDSKTWIYIKPGEDETAAREKYLQTYTKK